jgi:hypothetical protein
MTDELLRVLIYTEDIDLRQSIPYKSPEFPYETQDYPLDNPSQWILQIDSTEDYVGYLIVADKITIKEEINTKGHDLVLIAREITISPELTQVTINTTPSERQPAIRDNPGADVDNGGDLILIARLPSDLANLRIITDGGRGQDGGDGRDMTPQTSLELISKYTISNATVPMNSQINDDGSITGDRISLSYLDDQYIKSHECGLENEYFQPPKQVYAISGVALDAAYLTHIIVSIPLSGYPKNGQSGGYGGYPGKISIITPNEFTNLNIRDEIISALTGEDGKPGKGGTGGDITPEELIVDNLPKSTAEFIREYTIEKTKGGKYYVDGGDICSNPRDYLFSDLLVEPNDIEYSIYSVGSYGALQVRYYPMREILQSPVSERWFQRKVIVDPHMVSLSLEAWNSATPGAGPFITGCLNRKSYISPTSLNIILFNGKYGKRLTLSPNITEQLNYIYENWYKVTFDFVPDYPTSIFKQADHLFRGGEFTKAFSYYSEFLSFISDSDYSEPELEADTSYRLTLGSTNRDYFGFAANTKIPISPSRGLYSLDQYKNSLIFYNDTIRDAISDLLDRTDNINLLIQFKQLRNDSLRQVEFEIQKTLNNIEATGIDLKETESEIKAVYYSSNRLQTLLLSWVQYVDERIAALEDEEEEPGWKTLLKLTWEAIKIIAAIIAIIYGGYQAITKITEGIDNFNEGINEFNNLYANEELIEPEFEDWSETDIQEWQEALDGAYAEAQDSIDQAFKDFGKASEIITKTAKHYKDLEEAKDNFKNYQDTMNTDEAIDFRDNILMTEQIGITGGFTYLLIQEKIHYYNDLLISKKLAYEAVATRYKSLTCQLIFLYRERIIQLAEGRFLDDVIQSGIIKEAEIKQIKEKLKIEGQKALDLMMIKIQNMTYKCNYLNLDFDPIDSHYNKYIELASDVGEIITKSDLFGQQILEWKENNNNFAVSEVIISRNPINLGRPCINIVSSFLIDIFTDGEYTRKSTIIDIEPLSEMNIIQVMAQTIAIHIMSPPDILLILMNQFLVSDGAEFELIKIEELGFSDIKRINIEREKVFNPIFQVEPFETWEDIDIILAYTLAVAGISSTTLNEVINQPNIPSPLQVHLEKLEQDWDSFLTEFGNYNVISLRSVMNSIKNEVNNPANASQILIDSFLSSGVIISLPMLHLSIEDITAEIENSFDPDYPDYLVLESIYNGNAVNILLAVLLLYSGYSQTQLESVINQFSGDHVLRSSLNLISSEWMNLQRSVLEKTHSLRFNIDRDDFIALPNVSNTFNHRYLTAKADMLAPTGLLNMQLWIGKLPLDIYNTKIGLKTIELPYVKELLDCNQLGGAVWDDWEWNDLFGRAILGNWELKLITKGNWPLNPNISQIEVDFKYSFTT